LNRTEQNRTEQIKNTLFS